MWCLIKTPTSPIFSLFWFGLVGVDTPLQIIIVIIIVIIAIIIVIIYNNCNNIYIYNCNIYIYIIAISFLEFKERGGNLPQVGCPSV